MVGYWCDGIKYNIFPHLQKVILFQILKKLLILINHMKDITRQTSVSDSINEEGQKNRYKFMSKAGGT